MPTYPEFRFIIYHSLEHDPIINNMLNLNQLISQSNLTDALAEQHICEARSLLRQVTYQLLEHYSCHPTTMDLRDSWQDYFLNALLTNPNLFSSLAQRLTYDKIGHSYITGATSELGQLQQLFKLTWPRIIGSLSNWGIISSEDIATCWQQVGPISEPSSNEFYAARRNLKQVMSNNSNWSDLIKDIADFHYKYGAGEMGKYWVFRTDFTQANPLVGVLQPDPIKLEHLEGYHHIREQIITNTAKFVSGLPGNNVLLYGDRGTGKSSTVKALIHKFGPKGLRLIELTKSQLTNLPRLTVKLKEYPQQKFIIFIDDLSFEDNENEYKELKGILEGSVEVRPQNILIYATSNRRHLIREHFSDRNITDDELRSRDTAEEKLSLSDRFGITLIFPSPNQQEYLDIVKKIARDRGLSMPENQLEEQALKWALWQNGRSGRTAKQFIDHII